MVRSEDGLKEGLERVKKILNSKEIAFPFLGHSDGSDCFCYGD
jgi:hypothetical protein